ncbi:putative porin [Isoalcanivorax beigongshangi]|uniref:Porin n=1 Tax=Isoalcanivorax beigongshangi TaxID=3238810 RepID=A0ABV4ACW6_9GAMM
MKRKLVMLALLTAGVAQAQAPDATTVNLIRLLVEQGVLEAEQADALLRQAQQQAAPALTAEPGDVRVPYIPENVREEITASLREQVIAEAERDGWAAPGQVADWTRRIKVDADVRLRDESRFMGDGNDPYLVDYHRFNQEGPQDMSPAQIGLGAYPPFYNTTRDRTNLIRVRARLGVTAMLSDHWEAGLRLATGSSDDPVSTNQTLGGGLEKKDFWLDRGYIRWRSGDRWSVTGGRFATPFLFTDMLYSNDLNLDGLAVGFDDTDGSGLFATLGAFPLEYTSDDSPSRSEVKQRSKDKWLFGAQVGARFQFSERNSLLAAASFYEFDNISGERSAACSPWRSPREGGYGCSTDWSRPAFMQKGNTVFMLRDIALDPTDPAATPMPQYVGLAAEFQLLDLHLRWDGDLVNDLRYRVHANYIQNLGYSESKMYRRMGATAQGSTDGLIGNNVDLAGRIKSGDTAWMLELSVGNALDIREQGQWLLQAGYKRIEPDALPDAYNDASFHRGGTNAKGFYLSGAYGLHRNVWTQLRWMSTEEVYGAPLAFDIVQLDLNARF